MLLLHVVAFSYYPSLQYYTIEPINDIADSQLDTVKLRRLLYQFKIRKKEETNFVRAASTFSAAAVIGIFSWPSVDNSFWLARTLWYWSLFLSIFALISASTGRLLAYLPDSPTSSHSDAQLRDLLGLMLVFPREKPARKGSITPANASLGSRQVDRTPTKGVRSRRKVFFWQNAMMLMSWSWVTLFVGLALHVLTPLIMDNGQHVDRVSAVLVLCVGLAVYLNFEICNIGARRVGRRLREGGLHEIIDPSVF